MLDWGSRPWTDRGCGGRVAWLALVVSILAAQPVPAAPARHVILVSVDGLRPEFYLDTSWPAPLLQHLAVEGVSAQAVRPVFPSVTYPSHTTMVTGLHPARHGVYYNTPFEPDGYSGRWYWEYHLIKARTLWEAVHQAGGTTAAISWPVTVGAPIDFNIPEVWSLTDEAVPHQQIRLAARPPGLVEQLEVAVGRLDEVNYDFDYYARDITTAKLAIELLEKRPTVLAVHLLAADHFQHEVGREGLAVERAVATVDTAVGMLFEYVELLGMAEDTAWVITGDHGFVNTDLSLAPNVWLKEGGIPVDRPEGWRAVFHVAAASAFLYLRDDQDTETLAQVRSILAGLEPSVRRRFRVIEREELDALGAAPGAELAIAGCNGVRLTRAVDGPAIRASRGGTHGHAPDMEEMQTGFIGYGAGFRKGVLAPQMGTEDVYPIVAFLLGLETGETDGILMSGLVESGAAQ